MAAAGGSETREQARRARRLQAASTRNSHRNLGNMGSLPIMESAEIRREATDILGSESLAMMVELMMPRVA